MASILLMCTEDDGHHASVVAHRLAMRQCAGARTSTFTPDALLPWASHLRSRWRSIHSELLAWERQRGTVPPSFAQIEEIQSELDPRGGWRVLWLLLYGKPTAAAALFPETMALLANTSASSAMFSVLLPGEGLTPHRGDNKARPCAQTSTPA
eukprot:6477241-Prymnesium_polylepis.1